MVQGSICVAPVNFAFFVGLAVDPCGKDAGTDDGDAEIEFFVDQFLKIYGESADAMELGPVQYKLVCKNYLLVFPGSIRPALMGLMMQVSLF